MDFSPENEQGKQAHTYCIYSQGYYLHCVYISFSNSTYSWGGLCLPLLDHTIVTLQIAEISAEVFSCFQMSHYRALWGNQAYCRGCQPEEPIPEPKCVQKHPQPGLTLPPHLKQQHRDEEMIPHSLLVLVSFFPYCFALSWLLRCGNIIKKQSVTTQPGKRSEKANNTQCCSESRCVTSQTPATPLWLLYLLGKSNTSTQLLPNLKRPGYAQLIILITNITWPEELDQTEA